MGARIAFRALIGAGLSLAWLAVVLAWETGPADEPAAPPFWIVLVVATALALPALWREWSWAFVALGVAALGLVWLAVRAIAEAAEAASALVDVRPGAGAMVALVGAAALVVGVIVALRPPGLQLAGGLALFALVTGGAVALPQDSGRPDDGEIADMAGQWARALAFEGDTLYLAGAGGLFAHPSPDRRYRAARVDDGTVVGLAFVEDTAYLALEDGDRLIAIGAGGERRTLADEDFVAGPLAAGRDGSVYILQGNSVARWRDGRLSRLAPRFGGARAIAADAGGALFVADTANGRVHRIDPDGGVETIVGTRAPRDCVEQGLDDPLALDASRCTAVSALAVDRSGNLYLALENVGMILGLTPRGRLGVVAGSGPKGVGAARLGVVEALAVGPDGDLYVSESEPVERVRRIADPAGVIAAQPPRAEQPTAAPACAEIAALSEAATGVGGAQSLERAINGLAGAAPEELRQDVDAILAARSPAAVQSRLRSALDLGAYAERECGLVGGFAVPVDEANEFCVAYARYVDRGDLAEPGREPPRALDDVVAAAPGFVAGAARESVRELESEAGRAVPDAEAPRLLAGIEALDAAAAAMCVAA